MKGTSSNIHGHNNKGKLEHENWTSPWVEAKDIQRGLSLEVFMDGRQLRLRRVATSAVKKFDPRRLDPRHPIPDEVPQLA